ncbi:hypothetical protein E2C01_050419 [Portunus trituberculatus]|uniref:Uncharacterized protein n=1 Tax=Portunus trituberculatus TaxID=210409 RepID=A0A5B7GHA0_PORTR|nr:hypothetical protein [Portunus trituberculatus]
MTPSPPFPFPFLLPTSLPPVPIPFSLPPFIPLFPPCLPPSPPSCCARERREAVILLRAHEIRYQFRNMRFDPTPHVSYNALAPSVTSQSNIFAYPSLQEATSYTHTLTQPSSFPSYKQNQSSFTVVFPGHCFCPVYLPLSGLRLAHVLNPPFRDTAGPAPPRPASPLSAPPPTSPSKEQVSGD